MIAWLKSLFTSKPGPAESLTKSLTPVGQLRAVLGGGPGIWASDHRAEAQQYQGWNYVAIKAIIKQCAGAECQVFEERDEPVEQTKALTKSHSREIPDNFLELPRSHRLVKLMKRPNPNESGSTFIAKIALQLSLTGSAYIVKLRSYSKLPVELYVIPTGWVSAAMPSAEYPRGAYRIQDFRGSRASADGFVEMGNYWALAGAIIRPEDMIVIHEPHPEEPCDGQSPVSAMALWSDTAKEIDTARFSHMKNGVNPSLAIVPGKENDPTEEEVTRALNKINQQYAGSKNAGRAIIPPAGSTVTPLGQTAEEMDYQGGFEQLRNSVLAGHGVPGSAAGITDGGSYAAFYANLLQFITLTVQPLLNMVAEELARQLPEYGENIVIWLTAASVNDPEVLERQLQTDISAKSILINEVRALRGLPPLPEGDKLVGEVPQPPVMPGMGGMPAPQLGEAEQGDEKETGLPGPPKLASLVKAAEPEPECEGEECEPADESEPEDLGPEREREDTEIHAKRAREIDALELSRDDEDEQFEQARLDIIASGEDYDEEAWDLEDSERENARKREDMEREALWAQEDAALEAKRQAEDDGEPEPVKPKSLRRSACAALSDLWRSYP